MSSMLIPDCARQENLNYPSQRATTPRNPAPWLPTPHSFAIGWAWCPTSIKCVFSKAALTRRTHISSGDLSVLLQKLLSAANVAQDAGADSNAESKLADGEKDEVCACHPHFSQ